MRAALALFPLALLAFAPARSRLGGGAQGADLAGDRPPENAIWLDSLDVSNVSQGWGSPQIGKSVEGKPLTLGGIVYRHGIGTHAAGEWVISLNGSAVRFVSMVGVDDERKGAGSVRFEVLLDGRKRASTPVLHGGDAPQRLDVDLRGAKSLCLRVDDAGDGNANDHADWAGAIIYVDPAAKTRPKGGETVSEFPPRIVIPAANPAPAIHGPRVVGAAPGREFLFRIPATGAGPLRFSAKGLPAGLTLDPTTGIVHGVAPPAGARIVRISVRGPAGVARRNLKIVTGPRMLALTPPMGWNSWEVWAGAITQQRMVDAADALVASGLAAHGFQYVNIDDCWETATNGTDLPPDQGRDASGNVLTNNKFPNMKALADRIHRLGLKFGLYSSPGPRTCGGFAGSFRHEDQDARTYATWGVDFLKYDWCSYGDVAVRDEPDPAKRFQRPYSVMRASLDRASRDVVFSFCQYGMGDVWKWGADTGGNLWRTTGDLDDTWSNLKIDFESQNGHEKYAGPGHWNDPDMLMVGRLGWGNPRPTRLRPNEQILQISMWCLLAAPLLVSCDLTRMDPFTIALLSNDEALDIDQDPLGKPAGRRQLEGYGQVWSRPLADGATAVGLVNTGPDELKVTADWKAIGVKGRQPVRDLWLHRKVGAFAGSYSVAVPPHGCVLLKIGA
jgi:alpha-galactosidase